MNGSFLTLDLILNNGLNFKWCVFLRQSFQIASEKSYVDCFYDS